MVGMRRAIRRIGVLIVVALAAACATDAPGGTPERGRISISATSPDQWTVTYALAEPATELVFARQPDDSRTKDWRPAPGLEIVRIDGLERLHRIDGAPFREASVSVPPVYRDLPMDYGPFSPFGDGGTLMYSGRFFACPTECADDATWQVSLAAPGRSILVDGQRHAGRAMWTDEGSGRNVYVGEASLVETSDFLAVIDTALPETIRTQLSEQLPAFMHLFAERLGALPERPMLFASYDLSHRDGWGRQGGTLPGQVFVHFYGPVWPERMAKPGFGGDLAWHFAHEAAHLYQRQIYINGPGAWVHEGGAEALAALALRLQGKTEAANAQIAASAADCREKLRGRAISTALSEGEHDVAYACGLQVNLALDADTRRIAPSSDGLFTIWKRFTERVTGKQPTEGDFLLAVSDVAGADIAERIRALVYARSPEGAPW